MFGHWFTGGWGGMMGGWGWILMPLFWVGLVLLVLWVVRGASAAGSSSGSPTARDILDLRYARGEITRKEYEQMKKDIAGK
ncbi:MAG: SHOCT domain-containing protein [Anaerolineales bacterium]